VDDDKRQKVVLLLIERCDLAMLQDACEWYYVGPVEGELLEQHAAEFIRHKRAPSFLKDYIEYKLARWSLILGEEIEDTEVLIQTVRAYVEDKQKEHKPFK